MASAASLIASPAANAVFIPVVDLQVTGGISCGGQLPGRAETNSQTDHGYVRNNGNVPAQNVWLGFGGGGGDGRASLAPGQGFAVTRTVPTWGCPFRATWAHTATSSFDINYSNNYFVARN
ncbi:Secreted protein OS=Tsukamurella paurometabola (strain ATCC 8368 / DSM / CCUG 35730 / CIP 100753/ JCM 10117 / KCTC 9821 / NBRC 16120 / NCIMB 702349 / NCTC 13040) OX=521096 GN=Tpau_2789 PE=4 SV=1 [Tsukamurella paurometabola]